MVSDVVTESTPRTLLVAGGVALFCAAIVSVAVHYLRPMQMGLDLLQRNRAILAAGGLLPSGDFSRAFCAAEIAAAEAGVLVAWECKPIEPTN